MSRDKCGNRTQEVVGSIPISSTTSNDLPSRHKRLPLRVIACRMEKSATHLDSGSSGDNFLSSESGYGTLLITSRRHDRGIRLFAAR